jgi:hypothetical protein
MIFLWMTNPGFSSTRIHILPFGDAVIPRTIENPLPPYTNLPDNRVIDLEKPHRFFYEDVFVLAARGFNPSVVYGSVIRRDWDDPTGDFYLEMPYGVGSIRSSFCRNLENSNANLLR